MCTLLSCRPCYTPPPDKETNTVRVTLFPTVQDDQSPDASDKENAPPRLSTTSSKRWSIGGKEQVKRLQEQLQRAEELEREADERQQREEARRVEARRAELEQQHARELEEQHKTREKRLRQEEERLQRQEEQRRQVMEERQKWAEKQEELRLKELQQLRNDADKKHEELRQLLAKLGVSGVNEKKKLSPKKITKIFTPGYAYPLHLAAEASDLQAVELLLWGGADRWLHDSRGRTALALAWRRNKNESHRAVMVALAD